MTYRRDDWRPGGTGGCVMSAASIIITPILNAHQGADGQKTFDAGGTHYRDNPTPNNLSDKKIKLETKTEGQYQNGQLNPVPETQHKAGRIRLVHFPLASIARLSKIGGNFPIES
jgi:hypothetical protein